MSDLRELSVKEFSANPFQLIGEDWMLITAKKGNQVNTMTASWGGMGVIWNRKVAYVFIRHSRFTKEFIDASDSFSLTFFDTSIHRPTLAYLGAVSGRDENKIEKAGFTVTQIDDIPYFEEANTVLLCKKLSKHPLSKDGMLDETILPQFYADDDYHDMYIGEIVKVFVK